MFELPEVEVVRRELDRDLGGRKVKTVTASSMKVLNRYRSRKAFADKLEGLKISAVRRRGLYLTIVLGDSTLVVDLGKAASLRRHANKDPVEPHTEVVITFTQFGQLRLVDPDGSAEMFVVDSAALEEELPQIVGYGIDPIEQHVAWSHFAGSLFQNKAKLKILLTNEQFIVGIGNIYADEILYEAGLRYDRMSNSLNAQEIRRLQRSVVGTIHEAIKYRGTSLPERPFVDPFGTEGGYGKHLKVWGRHGQLSGRSRRPIKRVKFRGVWTYYCETQV